MSFNLSRHVQLREEDEPVTWFVTLFASKPIPANQNEKPTMRKRKIKILSRHRPDETADRVSEAAQERAQEYLRRKTHDRIDALFGRLLIALILIYAIFQAGRVLI